MPKLITFDTKDDLSINETLTVLNPATGLPIEVGISRIVQDWQLERHMPMFEADMTAAQKNKAQQVINKFKKP